MNPLVRRFAFLFIFTLGLGAVPLHAQRERLPPEDRDIVEQRWPNAKRTSMSLRYVVLKEGDKNGGSPKPGDKVSVLYVGALLDGKIFDKTVDPAKPFVTRIGRDELIEGWDQAIQLMHPGDKWVLIVPHELAYGSRGRPPSIPPRATLVFEIELLSFAKS